jgi:hypothetical protein
MSAVARLETLVEVDDYGNNDARTMSVSARLEAVLADGRRFVLLDDRGWSGSLNRPSAEVPDIWAVTSVRDIEETARAVVGPDEPFDGRSQEYMEATHWAFISEVLRQQGVVVGAQELQRLSHDVVIGERLQARIGRST